MPWRGTAATATTLVAADPSRINESIAVARDGIYVEGREGLNARPVRIDVSGKTMPIALP